ncbi:iron ABC transporter substrate-binding protein [Gallibacterium anatis str. Avicor]|nr:iron ABC transporter substrate-binding protein [Gallibacterium anatis str. Avicor]OZN49674.1 iron ABC transporter substrate-binding protein [Gallibacterium anatis]
MILMQRNLQGSAIINVLVTLMFLSLLLLSTQHWIKRQQQQTAILWQATQALQIAENQWNLRVIGENCEKNIQQNGIVFNIQCSGNQVVVHYPLGKIVL